MKQNEKTNDRNRLVRKPEAAELLGVSVRSIERLASSGQLKKVKVLGCVGYRMADVLSLAGIENSNPLAS